MSEVAISPLYFLAVTAASLVSLFFYERIPSSYRGEDTHAVVKSIASVFVLLTSLILGLLTNSAKNTYEMVDHNIHVLATDLIVLDLTLQRYGADGDPSRQALLLYAKQAARGNARSEPLVADRTSENLLNDVARKISAIRPFDAEHLSLWDDARTELRKIIEMRWNIVEQSEGSIPAPLLILLGAWLMWIFASFSFLAPKNLIVVGSLVMAAALIAGALYLILDMTSPFDGPIQVSRTPLDRAIAEMQQHPG
jgi:hypothetical protein